MHPSFLHPLFPSAPLLALLFVSCSFILFSPTYSFFWLLFNLILLFFLFAPCLFFSDLSFLIFLLPLPSVNPCFLLFPHFSAVFIVQKWHNPTQNIHTRKQQLWNANGSENTYSLPHTHHHTIKCKSWSNSCYVSACMCVCLPVNCVPAQCFDKKHNHTCFSSQSQKDEKQKLIEKTNFRDSLV